MLQHIIKNVWIKKAWVKISTKNSNCQKIDLGLWFKYYRNFFLKIFDYIFESINWNKFSYQFIFLIKIYPWSLKIFTSISFYSLQSTCSILSNEKKILMFLWFSQTEIENFVCNLFAREKKKEIEIEGTETLIVNSFLGVRSLANHLSNLYFTVQHLKWLLFSILLFDENSAMEFCIKNL